MTHSGRIVAELKAQKHEVLIPLLLDDPLWVAVSKHKKKARIVLIPLLLDDPLWVLYYHYLHLRFTRLNPSFAG